MVKEYYIHGGDRTPQYFCKKCKHAHTKHSKIGKNHKKYSRKAQKLLPLYVRVSIGHEQFPMELMFLKEMVGIPYNITYMNH